MRRWTLEAMMDRRLRQRSRARSYICRRDESQCRLGDTAQLGNWDKFGPKPTGNADGGEPFRGSWRCGKYSSSTSLNCEMMGNAFRSAISHSTAAADDGCVGGVAARVVRLRGLAELPP